MFPNWHVTLNVRSSEGAVEEVVFRKDRIAIGRSREADLVVPKNNVSRDHAVLMVDGDGAVHVADVGSTNGTFVNGKRLSRARPHRLHARDRVHVGDIDFVVGPMPERVADVMARSAALEARL